jgi:hypothetical protein
MEKTKPQTEQGSESVGTLSAPIEEQVKLPEPDPRLVSRPRMGKYSNVAKGGEDILIRIMDWFAGEKNNTSKETK